MDDASHGKSPDFEPPLTPSEFGQLLLSTRRRHNGSLSTREGLSKSLGISKPLLKQIEAGQVDPPALVVNWLADTLRSPLPPQRGSREGVLSRIIVDSNSIKTFRYLISPVVRED